MELHNQTTTLKRLSYFVTDPKQIADGVRSDSITQEDLEVIEKWVELIEKFGPDQVQNDRTWYDHELFDDWKGHRSSAFHFKGRIIYRILDSTHKRNFTGELKC